MASAPRDLRPHERFNFGHMPPGTQTGYYSPRKGFTTGVVREEDLAIDGRSWDYRDPYNAAMLKEQSNEDDEQFVNRFSSLTTNPLYDYSFGQVRDAAGELGITNVTKKKEVKDILAFIRGEVKEEPKAKSNYTASFLPEDPDNEGTGQNSNNSPGGSNAASGPSAFSTNRPAGSIPFIPSSSDEGRAVFGAGGEGGKSSLELAIESVADSGNRSKDDYFGRFLPEMKRSNLKEAQRTGRNTLLALDKFQGTVPTLGDPKELFEYYMGRISGDKKD